MTADTAGGVWTYARELEAALPVEVVLAAMGPREPEEDVLWRPYALEWMDDPWDDVARAGEWLLGLAEEIRPDVVHVNGYAHAALDWNAPVVCVAHSDVFSWFEAVHGSPAPAEWERYRESVEAGLRAADVVVSPTRAQLASLERHYCFETERLVIPNGRRPLEPAAKEPLVVSAGRAWDEAKNLGALERVELPWPVEIADGSRSGAAVESLLARASIFAEPTRYEPFGLSALEAALSGCALVLGDIASLREVWGDAAVFVHDDAELEAALRRLIGEEALRRDYAERARRRALEYSPERMAGAYLALYERLPARV
jgi:glycosyltransferase involved in cell wall biosynthesis